MRFGVRNATSTTGMHAIRKTGTSSRVRVNGVVRLGHRVAPDSFLL
jgi:hypothetical protein